MKAPPTHVEMTPRTAAVKPERSSAYGHEHPEIAEHEPEIDDAERLDEDEENEEDLDELQDLESRGFAGAGGEYGEMEDEDDPHGREPHRGPIDDDEF